MQWCIKCINNVSMYQMYRCLDVSSQVHWLDFPNHFSEKKKVPKKSFGKIKIKTNMVLHPFTKAGRVKAGNFNFNTSFNQNKFLIQVYLQVYIITAISLKMIFLQKKKFFFFLIPWKKISYWCEAICSDVRRNGWSCS